MRSIQDTLASAEACRRAADDQSTEGQREFYRDLHRYFLGLAATKQWLQDNANIGPHAAPE